MSRSTPRSRGTLFLLVGMALSCLAPARAGAVPAFSRKYQTACQTCHTIFPKLNPVGTAFRLNGYHLPGETEDMVKQKPVSLGADAYASKPVERGWLVRQLRRLTGLGTARAVVDSGEIA